MNNQKKIFLDSFFHIHTYRILIMIHELMPNSFYLLINITSILLKDSVITEQREILIIKDKINSEATF